MWQAVPLEQLLGESVDRVSYPHGVDFPQRVEETDINTVDNHIINCDKYDERRKQQEPEIEAGKVSCWFILGKRRGTGRR